MKILALAAFLASVIVSCGLEAQQVSRCGPRAPIVAELENKYAERRVHMGLVNNGKVIEVFAAESGTWTILITGPNGAACVTATGESWEVDAPPETIKKGTAL